MNTTATGGYLTPSPQFPALPGSLSFNQFVQSVFVGISGLPANLVRPKWQQNPPKQPDVDVNWLAFALTQNKAQANAFVGSVLDTHGNTVNTTQRMEDLEIQCAFYGPDSMEFAALTRDGFQIDANRLALLSAKMGFTGTGEMIRVPDLVNERWVDRYEMSFFLNREIMRAYPILTFLKASGSIEAIVSGNLKTVDWKTNA